MAVKLKVVTMTIDGFPYACPECDTATFTLEARGVIDALADVQGNCANYHSWEDALLTIDDLRAIQAASTGRGPGHDEDTFEIVIGGAVIAGTIAPELTPEDLKRVVRDVYWRRMLLPAVRRRKRRTVRALKRPVAAAAGAVKGAVGDTVAAAQAAALGAAWDWQTPGGDPDPDYKPAPVTACTACDGKGSFSIDSRIHKLATARCSVCSGTGQID